MTRGRLESVGSPSNDDGRMTQSLVSSSDHDRHRTVVTHRDQELTWWHVEGSESSDRHRDVVDRGVQGRAITIVHSPEAPSDGWEDSWKKSRIMVRSNCDRGAIEPRSWLLHRGLNATILPIHGAQFPLKMAGKKVHDRSPIVTQSWPDRHLIVASFEAKSMLIHRGIEATINAKGISPATPSICSHDRINRPRFSGEISL